LPQASFFQTGFQWLGQNWPLVLPILVAMTAVWTLLPQGRRRQALGPAVLGIVALCVLGSTVLRASGQWMFDVLFAAFAGLAIVSGGAMIVQRNPVYAALWFAMVVLSTCGLLFLQAASFLAASTMIVYAGAIIVTFLFVIMLAQQSGLADYDRRTREPLFSVLAAFLLLTTLLYVVNSVPPIDIPRLQYVQRRLGSAADMVRKREQPGKINDYLKFGLTPLDKEVLQSVPASRWRIQLQRDIEQQGLVETWAEAWNSDEPDWETMDEVLSRWSELITGVLDEFAPPDNRVLSLGKTLFEQYLYGVELAGLLLLVATVSAILIAQRRKGDPA
jgi:NADH:ubiquinone oxidoreductase subunit 6 (subunit J)